MTSLSVAVSEDEFGEILDRIRRFLDRVQQVADDLINNVNDAISWLPGFIADHVVAVLNRFNELLTQFFREIAEFVTEPGYPPGLFSASRDWTAQVGARTSALASTATLDETQSDDHWQGVAADAYRNTLPRQKAALEATKSTTDELSSALNTVAGGIITFWVAIFVAVGMFMAELLAAATAASTGVGAPPAAAAGVASTIKVIGVVTTVVGFLVTYLTMLSTQCTNLEQRLANNDAFSRGRWPRSTTDISDAGLNDGDGTDWCLK